MHSPIGEGRVAAVIAFEEKVLFEVSVEGAEQGDKMTGVFVSTLARNKSDCSPKVTWRWRLQYQRHIDAPFWTRRADGAKKPKGSIRVRTLSFAGKRDVNLEGMPAFDDHLEILIKPRDGEAIGVDVL